MIKNKNLGLICVITGSILIVLFAGSLLIRFLGTICGIMLLNYGLNLLRFPPLQVMVAHMGEIVRHQFKKNK